MTADERERVILALEALIHDTRQTLANVEKHGLEEAQPKDYQALLDILDTAVKQQRAHTLAMLKVEEGLNEPPRSGAALSLN